MYNAFKSASQQFYKDFQSWFLQVSFRGRAKAYEHMEGL